MCRHRLGNTLRIISAAAVSTLLLGGIASAYEWKEDQSFYSRTFGYIVKYDIILPDGYTNYWRYPVLYLLHDRGVDYTSWRTNSALTNLVGGRAMIIVLPNGSNSWYEGLWFTCITGDVRQNVEATYATSPIRGVGGIGMGGYGAFLMGGLFTNLPSYWRVHSCSSMSGLFVEPSVSLALDGVVTQPTNILAERLSTNVTCQIPLFFDCGSNDFTNVWATDAYDLTQRNTSVYYELIRYGRGDGTNLFYRVPPGAHDWDYWNSNMPFHLDFHQRVFDTYPTIVVTSHVSGASITTSNPTVRVAGLVLARGGLSNIAWRLEANGGAQTGSAIGSNDWYADIPLRSGRNDLTFTATTSGGTSEWTSISLFKRNMIFRVRRVKVSKKQLTAKTSDITYGDGDSLLVAGDTNRIFSLDAFSYCLTSTYWKRANANIVSYHEHSSNTVVTVKVNGKAQKDYITYSIRARKSAPTNFFSGIQFLSNITLQTELGTYGDGTNLTLDAKGRFRYKGPWIF